MNPDRLNFWLAIVTLFGTVTVLILARSAGHRKAAWRIADVARKLGLSTHEPNDPKLRSWLNHAISGIEENDRSIAWALRGSYEDRAMILLGIYERSSRAISWRSTDDRAPRLAWLRWYPGSDPAVPRAANQLLVLLIDPIPGLPEFRISPDTTATRRAASNSRGSPAASVVDRPAGELFEGLTIEPEVSLGRLPQPFLDRAVQVLVGRRHPWTIEGYDQRLSVRIARWQSHSRVRSYQSVLDEVLSLRAAWELKADRSDEVDAHRSIRSALERIRRASEPSASPSSSSEAESL